eukprot:8193077-Ditylum_brightwellii.AAC.1
MDNNASNYSYSHFFTGATNEQTLAAKHAYERVTSKYGYNVEPYHGDNSRFDSEEFTNSCKVAHQTYTYCWVGGH